ncbi:tRNA-uridine aminocarboxypropyltransferase [Ideonella sp. A 288]|uniref:tRNA-uridine aminocarboxypropyltransferase n=1 Tax=Ideonella sp. A 288 TaxID=1962181 RepID=UPI000B4B62DF|nr:tRNA-uridine aminocarboxypropyltransferase [Ideonella sp. A 288]
MTLPTDADAPPPDDAPLAPGPPAADPAPRAGRPTCPRCTRPLRACLCRWITPTDHAVEVLVLQHPAERHHAKGSARLLQLSLRHCRCEVGEHFGAQALEWWLHAPATADPGGPPRRALLLYPESPKGDAPDGPTRVPPPSVPLAEPGAWRLVLLDGTWRQAHRLLQAHPALQRLPRWGLPTPPPSRYTVRKARRAEQRSTLEAACLALGALEGRHAPFEPLLAAFDAWVAAQMDWRRGGPGPG